MIPTPRAAAPLLLLLSLAACGGESGPSFENSIDASMAQDIAEQGTTLYGNTLKYVFAEQSFGAPSPFFFAKGEGRVTPAERARRIFDRMEQLSFRRSFGAEAGPMASGRFPALTSVSSAVCFPVETGIDENGYPIDVDGDYIPDDYTADFDTNCSELVAGFIYTLGGKYRIRDTGFGFASYEFTISRLRSRLSDGSTGEFIAMELNGSETATWGSGLGEHHLDASLTETGKLSGESYKVVQNLLEDASFDPDAGQSFALAAALPSGLFDFHLDYELLLGASAGGNFRFEMNTDTPLHYSTGCATDSGIDSGLLSGLLNGNEGIGFQYTWVGCAPPTLGFFGVTE